MTTTQQVEASLAKANSIASQHGVSVPTLPDYRTPEFAAGVTAAKRELRSTSGHVDTSLIGHYLDEASTLAADLDAPAPQPVPDAPARKKGDAAS